MRRPETGGELMPFLQAVNWMHTLLPKMAGVVAPLRDLLEKVPDGGQHIKGMAKNEPITEEHWALERKESWDAALGVLRDAVKLTYPKRGYTNDPFWGSFMMQVSLADFPSKNTMEEWYYEFLGFMSESLRDHN